MGNLALHILQNKVGRPAKYTPQSILQKFIDFAQWLEDNPYYQEKGYSYMGEVTKENFKKPHIATFGGFCLFAGLTYETLSQYQKDSHFSEIIKLIKNAITEQKFSLAAAELVNANIIARDLGLADNINQNNTGTITQEVIVMTEDERQIINKLREKFDSEETPEASPNTNT